MISMNQQEIQKLMQRMEAEIQLLEMRIQKAQSKKNSIHLEKYPFFSPFIKAVLLTIAVLVIYARFS